MRDGTQRRLRERVKELTALHRMARILQDADGDLEVVMSDIVAMLPAAWQYPEWAEGLLRWGDRRWSTAGFRATAWRQTETFRLRDGSEGEVTVVYTRPCPEADEGPFLDEERELIRSLADMLRAWLQHRADDAVIMATNERLERQVAERTARLRRLAREVCLVEERERRQIAENLHDHLGQALALMKLRLKQLRGDAMLGGHDQALDELVVLSEQAITYTRTLTFELSPPVLYQLGLGAALEWYGERIAEQHDLRVDVHAQGRDLPDDLKVMLWKCARELLHNVVKHAEARTIGITLDTRGEQVTLDVHDDGRGFDSGASGHDDGDRFGLISIEERLRDHDGRLEVVSAPGRGTQVRLVAAIQGGDA